MAARQFSSHQEHYPSRSGGTLGADRKAATALVYQDVVAGVASTVAIQGDDGSIIAIQASALNTDNVIFNAATVYVAALGGGMIYVEESDYNLAATWNVSIDIYVQGAGWDAILNYNAGGNCITITGNNVKVRDLKIVIVAGAGAGGTRPNGIFSTTRTNVEVFGVWFVGDETVGDDGSDLRQGGIVFTASTFNKIINSRTEDARRHGIVLFSNSHYNIIEGNTSVSNLLQGIHVDNSNYCPVLGNICESNAGEGIRIRTSLYCTISENVTEGNTLEGIILFSSSNNNTINGNSAQGNTLSGIRLSSSCDYNTIIGNICHGNTQNGIFFTSSSNNIIVGNECNENDSGNTNTYDGIGISGDSDDNLVHSNVCDSNDRYGINIVTADCDDNWVKNNQLQGNTTAPFNDAGTGTKLATVPIQFIQGTTFISAAGNPWGWEIDLATEFALGIGWLPLELQQVVRINIIGVGLAAPGAGNAMLIELTGEGATFDEVYTTNAIDVANHLSEEENFAINDVIHWVFDVTDDAQIGTLLGGDRLQIKVLHNAIVASDIATDAIVDSIQVEYV